jgi:predicted branched-subunit amino acid permease
MHALCRRHQASCNRYRASCSGQHHAINIKHLATGSAASGNRAGEDMTENQNRSWLKKGLRDGIPIGLGYLAVSFALGISAKNAGLTAFQATLASLLCNASAGEYAGFTVIASNAPYFEMALITLIINARYLLMSAALSQKLPEHTSILHRLGLGYVITDEIFGASVTVKGWLNPFYNYGLALSSLSLWAIGTCLGVVVGNVLPDNVVSALSVLLYGMFLAIIIPPARENKVVRGMVAIAMIGSFAFSRLPYLSALSGGNRIIILTVVISLIAAILFPVEEEQEAEQIPDKIQEEKGIKA